MHIFNSNFRSFFFYICILFKKNCNFLILGILAYHFGRLFKMKMNGSLDENIRAFFYSAVSLNIIRDDIKISGKFPIFPCLYLQQNFPYSMDTFTPSPRLSLQYVKIGNLPEMLM